MTSVSAFPQHDPRRSRQKVLQKALEKKNAELKQIDNFSEALCSIFVMISSNPGSECKSKSRKIKVV
jgi:hypothetical protein